MVDLLKLKTANKCSIKILELIGEQVLIELAKDGLVPHYIVINPITKEENIRFIPTEVNEWFNNNYVRIVSGHFEPKINFIDFNSIKPKSEVPIELCAVNNLWQQLTF